MKTSKIKSPEKKVGIKGKPDMFRFRPKSHYMQIASLERLNSLSKYWKSNLEFYKEEISYMDTLISKYFIWLTEQDDTHRVQNTHEKLNELKLKRKQLSERVRKHFFEIEHLKNCEVHHEEETFRKAQEKLEDDIAIFVQELRKVKKKVFALTRAMMNHEKLELLID